MSGPHDDASGVPSPGGLPRPARPARPAPPAAPARRPRRPLPPRGPESATGRPTARTPQPSGPGWRPTGPAGPLAPGPLATGPVPSGGAPATPPAAAPATPPAAAPVDPSADPPTAPLPRVDALAARTVVPASPPGTASPAGRSGAPVGRPRRSRGRRVARALSWVAVAMSLTTLVGAGAGWAVVQHYDGNINRLDGIFGDDRAPVEASGPRTVLLVGSDSREGLAPGEDFQGTGAEFVTGRRADTIIVAHLYGDDDVAQLVSFPRDSWVTIPAHTDPETGEPVPAREAKINSAFQEGGPQLLVRTVEQLSGLEIDNYVQVDFAGFKGMVDALGGVEVCLPKPAKEAKSGIDLPAGRSVVQGEQALAFVRQRQGLPRGDIDRIARQQQFLGSIVRKTLSAGTLANPFKLNGFLDAATASLQVDEGLTIGGLRDIALRMRGFDSGGVIFSTVPVADPAARREGQSVVLLDEVAAEALFDGLRRDVPPGSEAPPPGAGEPGPPLVVAPQDVRVEVLNGAGVRGLAARVADDLQDAGFAVVGSPGNAGSGVQQTVVRHAPGRADSARTVAAAIPGAVTEVDGSLGSTVQVVAGSGYTGAVPVAVGEPAPPAPPAPAAPPVEGTTAAEDPCAV